MRRRRGIGRLAMGRARLGRLPLVATGLLLVGVACTETPTNTQLRALQSSGPTAFVCLGAPGSDNMARPLDDCSRARTATTDDYGTDDVSIPHLYALVTQPITGEVAVIDLTTEINALIDQDPAVPGASFLPVGALPSDIVATPGGSATFVANAQTNFEGIYALPSNMIRGPAEGDDGAAADLTSWPSCRLPAAPEHMVLLLDPVDESGQQRPSCDDAYGATDDGSCEGKPHCHGDLSLDAAAVGQPGRYKLAVTLPSEGGIAIVDAQALLDQEAGAAEPCRIERWLPLQVNLPPPSSKPPPTNSNACVDEPFTSEPFNVVFAARPGGLALADDELFIADRSAPVVHRVQFPTPCEPTEVAPLIATSEEDPTRVVTTARVAVSPLTLDLQRFLYAIDEIDGSMMVFNVSDDSIDNRPLLRKRPADNPFQPPDRIRFQTPPRDIVIVRHDNDDTNSGSGSGLPLRCDPDPDASGPATEYRTDASFETGAGPEKLRGVFAFAVLASGNIVAIDIDDYDAACRGPKQQSALAGCDPVVAGELNTSGEYSCNVVAPHQPRSAAYLAYQDGLISNRPSLASFPLLFDADGSLLKFTANSDVPRMRAPNESPNVVVGPDLYDLKDGVATGEDEQHVLALQLRDPRAHLLDQTWRVTFEGALPGFGNRFAQLADFGNGQLQLREVSSRFCSRGVLGRDAFEGILLEEGASAAQAAAQATQLADYVQIASALPAESDSYWDKQNSCTFSACRQAYGSTAAPTTLRDLRIDIATEDTLTLTPRETASSEAPLKCCMPGVVRFRVRIGNQWSVVGNSVGFLHHVTTDDAGQCRLSCDGQDRLLNGRVRTSLEGTSVPLDSPFMFENPFFAFAINGVDPNKGALIRDMNFQFNNQHPFSPLRLSVIINNPDVQPAAIRYLAPTGELVVSDGSLSGITLLDLDALAITRQYN